MTNALQLSELDDLLNEVDDVDLMLDPHHPGNDQYFKTQQDIHRKIRATKALLKPQHVALIEQHIGGKTNTQIALQAGVSPATVGRYVNSESGQRLIALSQYLNQHRDGPKKEHRLHMLYRIAVDNEKERPSIAISAIQEMNKLSGFTNQQAGGSTIQDNRVYNVQINGELLPRGALDNLPQTYDQTKQITHPED